jgi:hypothetical protein
MASQSNWFVLFSISELSGWSSGSSATRFLPRCLDKGSPCCDLYLWCLGVTRDLTLGLRLTRQADISGVMQILLDCQHGVNPLDHAL